MCSSETTYLLTELFDGAAPLDEVLKEAVLPLQVAWGEESQVNDHVVGHILVIEGAQQLLQAGLFLTELNQVHKLQNTGPLLLTAQQNSVSENRHFILITSICFSCGRQTPA